LVMVPFFMLFVPFLINNCFFYWGWLLLIDFVKLKLEAWFHGRHLLFLNGVLWCLRRA